MLRKIDNNRWQFVLYAVQVNVNILLQWTGFSKLSLIDLLTIVYCTELFDVSISNVFLLCDSLATSVHLK